MSKVGKSRHLLRFRHLRPLGSTSDWGRRGNGCGRRIKTSCMGGRTDATERGHTTVRNHVPQFATGVMGNSEAFARLTFDYALLPGGIINGRRKVSISNGRRGERPQLPLA